MNEVLDKIQDKSSMDDSGYVPQDQIQQQRALEQVKDAIISEKSKEASQNDQTNPFIEIMNTLAEKEQGLSQPEPKQEW
jgi:hypothetical protein